MTSILSHNQSDVLEDESTSVDCTLRKFLEIETMAQDVPKISKRIAKVQEQTQKTTVQVGGPLPSTASLEIRNHETNSII